jgi:hypothetical protein
MGLRSLNRSISALIVCAGVLFLSTNAMATLLAPGGTVAPGATASPGGAALVVDSGAQPFAAVDATSFSGTLRTQVYSNDAGNPFGVNALTFTFLLTNNGPDALERLVTISYTGYNIDVGVNAALVPGAVPLAVDRSANGKVIGWDYTGGPGVGPGGNSTLLVIHTNATQFVPVQNSVINGSVAVVASFGPAPIPEPATLGLAGIAMLGLIARRRSN